jgi:hypothetical protein
MRFTTGLAISAAIVLLANLLMVYFATNGGDEVVPSYLTEGR